MPRTETGDNYLDTHRRIHQRRTAYYEINSSAHWVHCAGTIAITTYENNNPANVDSR